MAYADDLTIVSNTTVGIKKLHHIVLRYLAWALLKANAKKCRTLFAKTDLKLQIQGEDGINEDIPPISFNEGYRYLGMRTHFRNYESANIQSKKLFDALKSEMHDIAQSKLHPSQKLHAFRVMYLTKFHYIFRFTLPFLQQLKKIDWFIRNEVRDFLALFPSANTAFMYTPINMGGLGLHSMEYYSRNAHVAFVTQCLSSSDPIVRTAAVVDGMLHINKYFNFTSRNEETTDEVLLMSYLNGTIMDGKGKWGSAKQWAKPSEANSRSMWKEVKNTLEVRKLQIKCVDTWDMEPRRTKQQAQEGLDASAQGGVDVSVQGRRESNEQEGLGASVQEGLGASAQGGGVVRVRGGMGTSAQRGVDMNEQGEMNTSLQREAERQSGGNEKQDKTETYSPRDILTVLNKLDGQFHQEQWQNYRDQGFGAGYHADSYPSYWMTHYKALTPAQFKAAIKTKLNLLSTASRLKKFGLRSKGTCRHCTDRETQGHAIQACPRGEKLRTNRHNKVLFSIVREFKKIHGEALNNGVHELYVDETVPYINSNRKPDFCAIHHENKAIVVLDVGITKEDTKDGPYGSIEKMKGTKRKQYKKEFGNAIEINCGTAEEPKMETYKVSRQGFACGWMGAHHPSNQQMLVDLGMKRREATKMLKSMTLDIVRGTTAIWFNHTAKKLP
eukprot:GHVU01206670.1.p1 GENE.GHVU01206670.1~~GHVU01206670.1.p1  ORF type:complete len:680 (+),score=63.65 GHVU01206670.1:34-2040(+)